MESVIRWYVVKIDNLGYCPVEYMPDTLQGGILYHSKRFALAIHLCACGCGVHTVTPLGSGEWSLTGAPEEPTLRPSIGNMQMPCRSHYYVTAGAIEWL
jgi:hypothetical protein